MQTPPLILRMGNASSAPTESGLEGRDVRALDKRVSSALAKGVRYNMKILIRGARKCGKSQLLRHLQGLPYQAEYTATPEIETAHVIWTCPRTDENVKVELWDTVDVGIQPKAEWAGVTGSDGAQSQEQAGCATDVVLLDAATINVYQGCDGVLVLYDPMRRETFDHAVKLVKEIPRNDIPVLLAANFADVCAGDASKSKVKQSELDKLARTRKLLCCVQMCCKDSFGVSEAQAFLSVPLLCLQQRYAEKQIRQAKEQLDETRERLDSHADTLNYAAHCAQWQAGGAAQARAQAERLAKMKAAAANGQTGPEPESPGTQKKMVPLEKLILPPRVDKDAPDLGREVASFSTGAIDEGFFSSDDEMGNEVEVMGMESDEEDPTTPAVAKDEDGDEKEQARGRKGGGSESGGSESSGQSSSASDESDGEDSAVAPARRDATDPQEEAAEAAKAEAARVAAEQKAKIEAARAAEEAKKRAEEARLAEQMQELQTGALEDGFLSDEEQEDDGGGGGAGLDGAGGDSSSDGGPVGNVSGLGADSDSDADDGGRPEMMGDEDIDSD